MYYIHVKNIKDLLFISKKYNIMEPTPSILVFKISEDILNAPYGKKFDHVLYDPFCAGMDHARYFQALRIAVARKGLSIESAYVCFSRYYRMNFLRHLVAVYKVPTITNGTMVIREHQVFMEELETFLSRNPKAVYCRHYNVR